jgi:hypothetical protein
MFSADLIFEEYRGVSLPVPDIFPIANVAVAEQQAFSARMGTAAYGFVTGGLNTGRLCREKYPHGTKAVLGED